MNFKSFLSLLSFASVTFLSTSATPNFTYQYKIVANSYHPFDEVALYDYKEKLIDNYEKLCFDSEEREYQDILMNNIKSFNFDQFTYAAYKDGVIILIIGMGGGPSLKGKLKKNACDESVIREKFYIYELLN